MSEEATLPKGIDQEVYDEAKAIIVSGFEANQDEDAIKGAMFNKGISFSNLVRLFKSITVSEGLVRSAKKIKADIQEAVSTDFDTSDLTADTLTWEVIEPVLKGILENVKGSTDKKVLNVMKAVLADADLIMPKKPKVKKGRTAGKINVAIAKFFAENAEATLEEFTTMIIDVTTEKSAKKWCRMYPLFSALAKNEAIAEA